MGKELSASAVFSSIAGQRAPVPSTRQYHIDKKNWNDSLRYPQDAVVHGLLATTSIHPRFVQFGLRIIYGICLSSRYIIAKVSLDRIGEFLQEVRPY